MSDVGSPKKKPDVPLSETWICEGCGNAHLGVNPPDKCFCGHEFFENMQDVIDELDKAAEVH